MKHLTPVTKAPAAAQTLVGAVLETKRQTIEDATNLKDFF